MGFVTLQLTFKIHRMKCLSWTHCWTRVDLNWYVWSHNRGGGDELLFSFTWVLLQVLMDVFGWIISVWKSIGIVALMSDNSIYRWPSLNVCFFYKATFLKILMFAGEILLYNLSRHKRKKIVQNHYRVEWKLFFQPQDLSATMFSISRQLIETHCVPSSNCQTKSPITSGHIEVSCWNDARLLFNW